MNEQVMPPVRLALRLLQTRDSAAYFSMATSVVGIALTPLDVLLSQFEKKLYRKALSPQAPILFVVGPPRSGTTICEQLLLHSFDLDYLTNLTAMFPRSPITAMRSQKRFPRGNSFHNYYGKTNGLCGPNDALYVWDRWVGGDRTRIPPTLKPGAAQAIVQFFGAFQQHFPRPTINKVNNMLAWAHHISPILPNCYFICMTRQAAYLAQSLYQARIDITGDFTMPYGLRDESFTSIADPIESVCEQVNFYGKLTRQQSAINSERFCIISYEEMCQEPRAFVSRVADEILQIDPSNLRDIPKIRPRNERRLDKRTFDALKQGLSD